MWSGIKIDGVRIEVDKIKVEKIGGEQDGVDRVKSRQSKRVGKKWWTEKEWTG